MTLATGSRTALATCRDVTVSYGRVDALAGVGLTIREGEALALWGRSGSGKSTLLHVLAGLVTPTRGTIAWHGQPRTSLVFQGANLLPYFTAFENVSFAADVSRSGASPLELLGLVGLDEKADSLPAELSGGEAQRVAIARSLAQRPALLLCDEPTGHLDSDTGDRVLSLIDALQHELGFALVVATHDADVAARLPREIELLDGRIVRDEVPR